MGLVCDWKGLLKNFKDLEIIDSKEIISCTEAEQKYNRCKFLMINIENYNSDWHGMVYAISKTPMTLERLVEMEDTFQEKGILTIVDGEYAPSVFDSVELVCTKRVE